MARRLGNTLALGALVAALAGCGSGVTYGVAPGPAEPTPITEPDPKEDAGPPVVTPPTDGGACVPGEARPATAAELEALVTDEFLGAFSGTICAGCHNGNAAQGGFNYDASSKATLVQSLLDSGTIEPGRAPTETTFGLFAGLSEETPPASHGGYAGAAGFPTTHRAVTEAFLDLASNGVEQECPDAGPGPGGDCTPVPVDEAQSFAQWETDALATVFSGCVACHSGNGRSPSNRGSAWGATTNDAAGWHEAAWTLAGAQTGTPVAENTLYTHLNGSDGLHPVRAAERDRIGAWLEYIASPQLPAGCE